MYSKGFRSSHRDFEYERRLKHIPDPREQAFLRPVVLADDLS